MRTYRKCLMTAVLVSCAALSSPLPAVAQTATPATAEKEPPRDPPPPLPPEKLKDAALVATGEVIWKDQCAHCHGSKAYPGKAPKLQPRTYKPEFVWDRVHNGFRGMPAWKEIYKPEEVVALVAYVLSDDFFP
jgi:mono/diheme cytochrome c family protein